MTSINTSISMRMHVLWRGPALVLALAVSAPGVAAQPGDEIGVVTYVDGTWSRTPGTQPAGPGDRLYRADTLTIRPGFTARKQVAVVLRGGRHVRFACPAQGACRGFVPADSLRGSSRVAGPLAVLLDGVIGLLTRDLPTYAEGIVRGDAPASDAVLRLRGGVVDIAPMLRGGSTGSYHLRFHPRAGSPGVAPPPVVVTWAGTGVANVTAGGLAPGLYTVEVRAAGAAERPGAHAWVLLADEGFEAREQAFRGVRDVVEAWHGAREVERRTFLRGTLDCLARGADPVEGCS